MLLELLSLMSLFNSVTANSGVCAKNVHFDTETTRQYNQDADEYVSETKISFSIGLLETVCFQIEGEGGKTEDTEVDGREYYFSFEDVQSIFTYKNAYTFGLGEPKVKCLCDCPGVENHCSPARESCEEDGNSDSNCFNFFSDDHSNQGCGITSFLGDGEVCCSVSVREAAPSKYTAFEIATPVTRSLFRIEKDSPFESRQFASDLASGSPHFDGKLQFTFVNPGNINPLPDGWYFGKVGDKVAYTNVEVNGLSDWDVNKLGWYKYQNNQYSISQTAVKNAFDNVVLNCDSSDMEVSFYSDANITYAKSLEEFYTSTVSKAVRSDAERTLMLSYYEFSKINVVITINGNKEVVQRYSMPQFLDFDGAAMFDKHSNRFLNVSITSGKGTLYGSFYGATLSTNFDITIVSEGGGLSNYTNYVQITQWCNDTMLADLCFHAGDNIARCKVIRCHEEPLEDFILPESAIDYEIALKANFFGLATWGKYANPLEWFNGFDNWQEGVIMLISLVCYIIVIAIITKLFSCFKCGVKLCKCLSGCCCGCCRPQDKDVEADYGRDLSRRKHSHAPLSPNKSNISERSRKVTRNRGRASGVGGSIRYAGSSIKSMGSSMKKQGQKSKRLIQKYGSQNYTKLQQLLQTMPAEDIKEIIRGDGYALATIGHSDTRVCLEIDSDECLNQHDMFTDPHKRDRSLRSNKSTRSNKSHKRGRRDDTMSPSGRSERAFSPAGRPRRKEDRAFSPNGRNNPKYQSSRSHKKKRDKYDNISDGEVPRGNRKHSQQPRGSRDPHGSGLLSPANKRRNKQVRNNRTASVDAHDGYSSGSDEESSQNTTSSSSSSSVRSLSYKGMTGTDHRRNNAPTPTVADSVVVLEGTPVPKTPIISIDSNPNFISD